VAEVVDRDVDETARLLRHMDEILGLAPQLSLESLDGEVRGQNLREIAVELLRQMKGRQPLPPVATSFRRSSPANPEARRAPVGFNSEGLRRVG
jgi:hypothetical protein